MALTAGTRLGVYEVTTQIGAGGMGQVWRARDTKLNRDVALKVLPDSFANDPDRLARFTREAQTLAALNHPNIAHIHGLEESGGIRALVMELVEGEDLSQRIARGAIPIDEALPIAKQIADALEAAHEQGIIHRDLKPANIKVREDGTVKVLDFGLAKAMEPARAMSGSVSSPTITTPGMTQAGMILGTAAYMSPEQARGQPADERSDIWTFGVVLYEMLTGERLFRGDSITDVLAAIVRTEPELGRVPWRVRRVLRSCVEKDRRRRLQAIGDAWLLLEETAREPRSSQRTSLVLWLAVVAFVVAVGAGLWTLSRKPVADARTFQFQVSPPPGTVFQTGIGSGAAISPDGRAIAFVTASTRSALWVRRLDSPSAYELPGTTGAAFPFWRPDSRALGFFAEGKLKTIDISGGPPFVVTPVPIARGGSWDSDGTVVFSASVGPLQRVAASGGIPAPLTTLDLANGENAHRWPQLLPDTRHLLYFVRSSKPNRTGIYLASLDHPDEKVLILESASAGAYVPAKGNIPGYLLWARDNALMAQSFDPVRAQLSGEPVAIPGAEVGINRAVNQAQFSLSNEGTLMFSGANDRYELAWFSRDGKVLGTVSTPRSYAAVRMSPDGNNVALALIDPSGGRDIWKMELARGLPNRLTHGGQGFVPVWSPDGHQIAYHDASQTHLLTMNADGDRQQIVMKSTGFVYINDWSSDGQFLMYTEISARTSYDLWLVPATQGGKPVPVLVTAFDESHGQFSPDGSWVAYTSNESGQQEIYVRSVTGKGSTPVSTSGGNFSRWRKDGRELFYRSLDGSLMSVSVANAGDGLKFGAPVSLLPIVEPVGTFAYPYDVAPDGQRILALTPSSRDVAPLMIIVNWEAGLRK